MEINQLYLDLIKNTITDQHRNREEDYKPLKHIPLGIKSKFLVYFDKILRKREFAICKVNKVTKEDANSGHSNDNKGSAIGIKKKRIKIIVTNSNIIVIKNGPL